MKGDKIEDQDHIARYCKPTHVSDGQVQATAFMLRKGEPNLSVNWLEFLDCPNREIEISELRKIYPQKLRVGKNAKIAVLNIGEVRKKVQAESPDKRNLEVLHDPDYTEAYEDPSHSGIYNLKLDDELIAELILETVLEEYSARH